MNRGEALVVPQLFQGRETRMQAEVPVEIDDRVLRHGDARPLLVVERVAVRNDHVQTIDRAALEQADENRTVGRPDGRTDGGKRGAGEKERIEPEAHESKSPGLHEDA